MASYGGGRTGGKDEALDGSGGGGARMVSSGVTRRTAAAVIGTFGAGLIGGTRGIAAQATPVADAVPADFGVVFHVSADDHWP